MTFRRIAALTALLFAILLPQAASANFCAIPGKDGVGSISGTVNSYWPATNRPNAGSTTITLGAGTGPAGITAGDLLLVIQMQDSQIDRNNDSGYGDNVTGDPATGITALSQSGQFEFVRAANTVGLGGGSLTIVGGTGGGLLFNYDNVDATGTRGARRFQVIRVPQYSSATLGAGVTAPRWNGTYGGVVVIDVATTLNLSGGSATVTGLGFRGGGARQLAGGGGANTDYRTNATVNNNGSKGEGIAGTPRYLNDNGALLDTAIEGYPNGSHARGAPGNAGGGATDGTPVDNQQNSGGGGGAGYGTGGKGGDAWCPAGPCPQSGGFGGSGVTGVGAARVIAGGGGGSGSSNNGTGSPGAGFASSGAAGGGIIIVRTGVLSGSGTFSADGAAGNSTVLNDGSGGGGGGGGILVGALSTSGLGLSLQARGGTGGSNSGGGAAHGPGGGGGGGFVGTSFGSSGTTSGGSNGTTFGGAYGSTSGTNGTSTTITTSSISGISSGAECTPVLTKSFNPVAIFPGGTSRLTLTVSNPNPNQAISALAFTDSYPAGVTNTGTPGVTAGCGPTVTAVANAGSIAQTGGTLAANSNCSVGVNVTASTVAGYNNSVVSAGLTATLGGSNVTSLVAASATLTVSPPLSATKLVAVIADPVNNLTDPKNIPAATVEYTINIDNATAFALDTDTVVVTDAIPVNTNLFVGDLGGPGSGPVSFTDGAPASGLTFTFTSLASAADDVEFSSNGGVSYVYTPTPGGDGTDPAVTHLRILPKAVMASTRSFIVKFHAKVE